ncbi:uridine kinase [Yinghuangia seranimata]|uniref:uridine kinase n=1 Tax=Yinghuangia seranimata TaxID=408067 RepID=UPI00248CC999|nr:uridine kinase [Yinghuangia seranimata]MDI2129982.1 uridine kinase [Yinghuangia seranimata]
MRVRPLTPQALADHLAEVAVARVPAHGRLRFAVDGAAAAEPGALADLMVDPIRAAGHPVQRVSADDFLKPASVRLEHGRQDADAFYWSWLDEKGLVREVLEPAGPGGTGRVLPSLWDAERDRASRAPYVELPPGGVLLLDGPLLLGRGLPVDFTVHLSLSDAALARRTPDDERWTLPAYARYRVECLPEDAADLVVRWDDPRRPALVEEP